MPTPLCVDARTGVASARLFSAAEAGLEGVDSGSLLPEANPSQKEGSECHISVPTVLVS